jgi:hypothetical protein
MNPQHQLTTNLYINPSYIAGRYDVATRSPSLLQIHTRQSNFKSNQHRGKVSKQSKRKLRLGVQWLVMLAEDKKVWDNSTQSFIKYKAGLATVSLPTGCTNVDERFFRDTLLTSILSAMNYQWDLKNYLWKIERQANGTLHAHITVDKFIPHKWLLSKWCGLLDKHGLLEEYKSRFRNMTAKDYVNYRKSSDHPNVAKRFKSHIQYTKAIIGAYQKGEKNGWTKPNCTDIHAVKNVRYLASYMVKYMSKDPNLGESFKGRFWSCSHNLSKLRSIKVSLPECDFTEFNHFISPLVSASEDFYYISKTTGEIHFLGCVYFLKKSIKGIYKNSFLAQLFGIIGHLYHNSTLNELPEFELTKIDTNKFHLHKNHDYAY